MREFNYVIIGGGCAGLSLAYELEIHKKLKNKTLAIIEPRTEYKRDKMWSFWKVIPHNFEDCVKKSWDSFYVKEGWNRTYHSEIKYPYQTIDSGLFYKKILNTLKKNKNISFFKNIKEIKMTNSFIFNSVPKVKKFNKDGENYWQHFYGIEIETKKEIEEDTAQWGYDKELIYPGAVGLIDFDTMPLPWINFIYILPFTEKKVFLETTWITKGNRSIPPYEHQILNKLRSWNIISVAAFQGNFPRDDKKVDRRLNKIMEGRGSSKFVKNPFKVNYKEHGAIPLFHPVYEKKENQINIGTAGHMTRLSTGYTFLNIQEHSKYIRENIENIRNAEIFKQDKKYLFYDKIFMKVLEDNEAAAIDAIRRKSTLNRNRNDMKSIFLKMFSDSGALYSDAVIKFLSNKSNFSEDLSVILKMPKWTFIKALFK